MALLARIKIATRILIIGAAYLVGLGLVLGLSVQQLDRSLQQRFQNRTRQTLDVAYRLWSPFHDEEKAGRMTRVQAQRAAEDAIRARRFGADNES